MRPGELIFRKTTIVQSRLGHGLFSAKEKPDGNRVNSMMRIALPIAAFALISCADVSPSLAQAYGPAPWCAVMETGGGSYQRECVYDSIEDCAPNVIAGNRGFCQQNPFYRAVPAQRHWRYRPDS
jgi:hypothetical protein